MEHSKAFLSILDERLADPREDPSGRLNLHVRSWSFGSYVVRQAQSQPTQPSWACTDSQEVDDGFLAIFSRINGNDCNSVNLVTEASSLNGPVSLHQGVQDPVMALIKKIKDCIRTPTPAIVDDPVRSIIQTMCLHRSLQERVRQAAPQGLRSRKLSTKCKKDVIRESSSCRVRHRRVVDRDFQEARVFDKLHSICPGLLTIAPRLKREE